MLPPAANIHTISETEHILMKPWMYIGSIEKTPRRAKCLGLDKITIKEIQHSEGMEQIFLEILNNASVESELIEVSITSEWITVKNYGTPIPVIQNENGEWIPTIIFGKLRTFRNYNHPGNLYYGIGAKAVNVFSTEFNIECADSQNGLLYKQTWKNNMSECCPPEITPYEGSSYVQVSYSLDFARFGVNNFDQEALELYAYHCARISYNCSVPVIVNEKKLEVKNLLDYAKMFYPDNTSAIYYKDPEGIFEICILDTPDNAICESFVNGVVTSNGGIHVNAGYKIILEEIRRYTEGVKVTKKNIVNHVSLFVSCRVSCPQFTSQMKDCFVNYNHNETTLNIKIPYNLLKNIENWSVMSKLGL